MGYYFKGKTNYVIESLLIELQRQRRKSWNVQNITKPRKNNFVIYFYYIWNGKDEFSSIITLCLEYKI
jgi:hypothetical protein